jgi:hypothetical protein
MQRERALILRVGLSGYINLTKELSREKKKEISARDLFQKTFGEF